MNDDDDDDDDDDDEQTYLTVTHFLPNSWEAS
jgi:hypothetical protein